MQFFQLVQHVDDADLGVWTLQAAVHLHVDELPNCHVTRHVRHYVAVTVIIRYLHHQYHHVIILGKNNKKQKIH